MYKGSGRPVHQVIRWADSGRLIKSKGYFGEERCHRRTYRRIRHLRHHLYVVYSQRRLSLTDGILRMCYLGLRRRWVVVSGRQISLGDRQE